MKVVLSIDPVKFPLTGIGRYTYELARGLQQAMLEQLLFLHGSMLQRDLPVPGETQPMDKASAWKEWARKSGMAVALFQSINPWLKGRALKGLEDHIFHGPNYSLPPFAGRSVVTMHDLSIYLWPRSHPPERVRYLQAEIKLSLQRATALITDTEYTRHEVSKFFGWPLDRVYAVPLASTPEFKPRSNDELALVLRSLDLEAEGYTLFTGTVEPRKNITVLLDAYARLPNAMRQRWPLVIAGYSGWSSDEIHARMACAQREGWSRYLGYVPADILPALMAGARLFAYPSLYEGFGLPVLEAMASGVPVVCSNASTLPEVAGDAAAFHDPADADTLLQLLRQGLEDEQWRAAARQAGLAQSRKFSWQCCAEQTLAVYQAVSKA